MSDTKPTVTVALGEHVRLRGTSRYYTGIVMESGPNMIYVKIGDSWFNRFKFQDGVWVGIPANKNREAPKTRVIGLIHQNQGAI